MSSGSGSLRARKESKGQPLRRKDGNNLDGYLCSRRALPPIFTLKGTGLVWLAGLQPETVTTACPLLTVLSLASALFQTGVTVPDGAWCRLTHCGQWPTT